MFILLKKKSIQRFIRAETKIHELNYLFWECTARCNLNCLHCGSDCSQNSSFNDMPLSDFLTALDTIEGKSQKLTVVLTGGEPLLRNDIELCGREIRKRNARWSMVSNGYLYDRERHVSLLNAGMGALTFCLDGMKNNHNWLRKSGKSFDKVDGAISLAASSTRINFDIVTCVNTLNIYELTSIYKYLISKGVKAWRLFTINPVGRAKDNFKLYLSGLQLKFLLDFISRKRKEKLMDIKFSCEGFVGDYEFKVRDSPFFCRAGINIGSVLIDGSISACPNIDRDFSQGNIYKDKLNDIWNNEFKLFRDRCWTKKGQCGTCDEYTMCLGNGFHTRRKNVNSETDCHYRKLKLSE